MINGDKTMKMYIFIFLCLSLIYGTSGSEASPNPAQSFYSSANNSSTIRVPDFAGMSDKEANDASDKLFWNLGAVNENILKQLQNRKLTGQQKSALYRLAGELQVGECEDQMINDIQFVDHHSVIETALQPFGINGKIAQAALINNGLSTFGEIMRVMSDQRPAVPFVAANADAYAYVLYRIEGNKYATLRLTDQMKLETSPTVLQHYELVLNYLKRYTDVPD